MAGAKQVISADDGVESAAPGAVQLLHQVAKRFSWGLADQGMSSLSNAAISLYVARELGAEQFGAFSVAYVTYAFVLNASRGLATDPLLVRFSHVEHARWRHAVQRCTATAVLVGLIAGICSIGAAAVCSGTTRAAFFALGITLPGLMLQDSWRYSFFAATKGSRAFVNDTIWTVSLGVALVGLRLWHHETVFWMVLAWGLTANLAALCGLLQARLAPKLSGVAEWLSAMRDLGPRYLLENTSNSGAGQLRVYIVGFVAGLTTVGHIQEGTLLMGPFFVIFMGISLVTVPEAARSLRRSAGHLQRYCLFVGAGLSVLALAWGLILLIALPDGLGALLLHAKQWEPVYGLVVWVMLTMMGSCVIAGAAAGLHALGAARRSLRAMLVSSAAYLILGVLGAVVGGATGSVQGTALATWIGVGMWWWQLRLGLRDHPATADGVSPAQLSQPTTNTEPLPRITEPLPRITEPMPRLTQPLLNRKPSIGFLVGAPGRTQGASGRLLILYGRLLGPLLLGYMFFDKAFAYIHLPGTPLYVGEMVLTLGGLGVLFATGYLRIPLRDEPVLAILTAWFVWGFIRFLPGLETYGIWAVRDFALCYYCLFAYFTIAALARAPELLDTWLAQLSRVLPWLLTWLPFAVVLASKLHAPSVPFSGGVSILTHEPGNAGIAALVALGYMWLFPGTRSARSRAMLSIVALVTIALAATQNRASLLGVIAGATAGLMFLPGRERLRLITSAVAVAVLGLGLAITLSLQVPGTSQSQGRAFSASQLVDNVLSIGAGAGAGDLGGTVAGRDQLWSLVFHQQVVEGKLFDGLGFGVNLPYLVGDTQVTYGPDPLRSPHNSHDDVLARMGLIGFSLWIALLLGWYWQLAMGCRRLARRGLHARRQVAVLCIMVVSTILVTSYFSPQLEGAQIAALQWTAFGVGIAVTSSRGWFGRPARTGLGRPATTGPGRDQRLSNHGRQVPPTVNVPAVCSQRICQEEKSGQ